MSIVDVGRIAVVSMEIGTSISIEIAPLRLARSPGCGVNGQLDDVGQSVGLGVHEGPVQAAEPRHLRAHRDEVLGIAEQGQTQRFGGEAVGVGGMQQREDLSMSLGEGMVPFGVTGS